MLLKFTDDTKLGGQINILKSRAAIKGLSRLEGLGSRNFEIQQGQRPSNALGKNHPLVTVRAGD